MLYVNVLVKDFKHLSVYLGIYPREIKTFTNSYTRMFIAVLFIIA